MRRLIVGVAVALAGCAGIRDVRLREATAIAGAAGLAPYVLEADGFRILAFAADGPRGGTLTVYLEGDGRAWVNPWQPSTDPTPSDPTGLRLAVADPARPLLYLARPCQFVGTQGCDASLWTGARLSPRVIAAYQSLLDAALRRTGSGRLGLVGYSGGGALATVIAEHRRDVAWLVTVAADLDLAEWARLEQLAPLAGSLDPAEHVDSIARLPQIHFAGADDAVVPPAVAQSFLRRMPAANAARLVVMPGFDHDCCWVDAWPRLVGELEVRR